MQSITKTVDNRLLLEDYARLLRQEPGLELPLTVSGNSMHPFLIHGRDTVYLRHPEKALRRGDMVLYRRESGQHVLHRIRAVKKETLSMVGDGQTKVEHGIRREQVVAVVTRVDRKGKELAPGSIRWEFFAKIWIRILPLRRPLCRAYERFRRKK